METIAPEESKTVAKESFLSPEEVAALAVPDSEVQNPEIKVTPLGLTYVVVTNMLFLVAVTTSK